MVELFSLFTSLAFIVLTYFDLRYLNPCCKEALDKYAAYKSDLEEQKVLTGDNSIEIESEHDFVLVHGVC